jgi:hypothetical protein
MAAFKVVSPFSFVVYETAIEKMKMTRTKAPVLTFLWRLNQSGPFGKRSLNSDALIDKVESIVIAKVGVVI